LGPERQGEAYVEPLGTPSSTLVATGPGSVGASAVYLDLSRGEHLVRLAPQDPSKKLHCSIDPPGFQPVFGATTDQENVFRTVLTSGFVNGLWAYCSLD
jgi:hypothetical protein